MGRIFLIRRKGFNYYTDYTELYLHRVLENYGFHLVKDKEKCLFEIDIYIPETEKYIIVASTYFDDFSEEEASVFLEVLSRNFKSEVITLPNSDNIKFTERPYKVMFSDMFNAFEEPAFIKEGNAELVRRIFMPCISGQPYIANYINYGGGFKGLKINISFDRDDVELEETTISYFLERKRISRNITFEKKDNGFYCRLDDFEMKEGINRKSAVLRAKKKTDEENYHSCYLRFIPVIKNAEFVIPYIKVAAL